MQQSAFGADAVATGKGFEDYLRKPYFYTYTNT